MDEPSGIDIPLDADALLGPLSRHGVDFVIIGGLAGLIHGSAYPTYDIDIAYSRESGNLERLASALGEMGVTLRGAPADLPFKPDLATLTAGANFTFETPHGNFDILGHDAGISGYEDLRREAVSERIDGIEVKVASIDHLIAMKRAANRTKDRLMVEEYIVIADEQQRLSDREGG